jgi:hypothetical protein
MLMLIRLLGSYTDICIYINTHTHTHIYISKEGGGATRKGGGVLRSGHRDKGPGNM